MRRSTLCAACCLVLAGLVALPSAAAAGESFWRVRAIYISPDDSSTLIGDTGSQVSVDSALAPEIDFTWMLERHWGIELVLATARHDLAAKGGALDGADLGSVWLLPPTVTVQYHFLPDGAARPYIGFGVTLATFYKYETSQTLRDLGVSNLDFSDGFNVAAQLGIDFDVSPNWFLNFDLKYIKASTNVEIKLAGVPGGTLDTVGVDIDPWIAGIGIGHRF